MKRLFVPATMLFAAAMFLAACGGSDDGGESSRGSGASTDTATTVATKRIDGKSVLVDADGNALYTSDQEAGGVVRCTGACLEFWEPLTVEGGQPTGNVNGGTLGVLTRPDGTTQVTFNGDPVYRFTEDQSGAVTGDGLEDAFEGQTFTWHVVTAGASQPSAPPTTSGSGGGVPGY
jgi:predicted lipoprotein with Yx(FWY)xxD motif